MDRNLENSIIDERLLYRKQFFIGPKFVDHLSNWTKTEISSNHFITSHPDLEVTVKSTADTKLILLGFILDPDNPSFGNMEILADLLAQSHSFNAILKNTDRYSGRWVITYSQGNDIKLFTDAAGSRSVFYHFHEDATWCASQPHTIAEILSIERRDDKDFLDFINSKEFEEHENTLFGNDTLFKDIYRLLPNHYLSINEQYTKRFWPNKLAKELNIEQAIKTIAPVLKALYEAANKRFKLIQPVTAGRDSRLLLAASKDVRHNIYYFIQKFKGIKWYSRDIRLPNKLLKYLGLEFHVEKCKEYNLEFDRYLRKNVFMLQTEHKKILHYNFFQNFQGFLNVSGNYTGIYRPFKWQVFAPPDTPLIRRTNGKDFRKYKYVVDYINNWEEEYNKKLTQYNYPVFDIFYWENKAANWVSMFVNELDIAIEEWCPVNNRKILSTILAVDPAKRINENFQHQIVEYLWKDVLHESLAQVGEDNPYRIRFRKIIYNLLKLTGLLNPVRSFYNRKILK